MESVANHERELTCVVKLKKVKTRTDFFPTLLISTSNWIASVWVRNFYVGSEIKISTSTQTTMSQFGSLQDNGQSMES
jgi:hypothetical protein